MADKPINTENIRLNHKDKMAFIGNLSTMLKAGISIIDSVDSLLEDSKGNQQKLLQVLRADLVQGKHVYASFSKFPKVFDKVTVNIIKASEEAGTLDVTLDDIKDHIQKEMEFMDKVKSAMTYPLMIFGVFLLVLLMILVLVVPKMAQVFSRMKADLPLPTQILIFLSELITKNTIALSIGLGVIILFFVLLYRNKREWITGFIFSLPLISNLIREIDLTRFTRSMALLLSSGLTITNALELSEDVVMRKDVKQLIKHSHAMVLSGKSISDGLRDGKSLVPMIMVKIIEAGEKTGSLDTAMQDISEHMDYQVSRTLSSLTTVLEPLMLVVIGFIVGGMMLSIIAPIYNLIGQFGR